MTKSREQSEAEKAPVDRFAEGQANSVRSYNFAKSPAPNEHLDLFYVQASPEQIKGAVADLRGTPQAFPSVTYSVAQPVVENEVLESLEERNRQLSRDKVAENKAADGDTIDGSTVNAPAAVNRRAAAGRGGRGGGQSFGISGPADEARSKSGGGGGFGGGIGRGAAAQNSFGGGGFGGNAAQPAPAQNLSASEPSKEAELKKWNDAADAKLPERDKMDFDADKAKCGAEAGGAVRVNPHNRRAWRHRWKSAACNRAGHNEWNYRRWAGGWRLAWNRQRRNLMTKPIPSPHSRPATPAARKLTSMRRSGLELYLKPSKELPLGEVDVAAVSCRGANVRRETSRCPRHRCRSIENSWSGTAVQLFQCQRGGSNGSVERQPLLPVHRPPRW